jgi:hypothetical protein
MKQKNYDEWLFLSELRSQNTVLFGKLKLLLNDMAEPAPCGVTAMGHVLLATYGFRDNSEKLFKNY